LLIRVVLNKEIQKDFQYQLMRKVDLEEARPLQGKQKGNEDTFLPPYPAIYLTIEVAVHIHKSLRSLLTLGIVIDINRH
jgi:hypothetical protein